MPRGRSKKTEDGVDAPRVDEVLQKEGKCDWCGKQLEVPVVACSPECVRHYIDHK